MKEWFNAAFQLLCGFGLLFFLVWLFYTGYIVWAVIGFAAGWWLRGNAPKETPHEIRSSSAAGR